jgi:hypothetical protein
MCAMKWIVVLFVVFVLCLAGVLPAAPAYAQTANGWLVQYYPNTSWTGVPVLVQNVPGANLNWNGGSPGPGVPARNFTAYLTANAYFDNGTYRFTALADDEVMLQIDGATVLNTIGTRQAGQSVSVDVAMTSGVHQLGVFYRQFIGPAYLNLSWTPPSSLAPPVTLPETGLTYPGFPSSASGVVTQFGDYTRCIQQGLHQANCFVPNASGSPNLGSIQMEPPIQIWAYCTADQVSTFTGPDNVSRAYKCSKTEAGWFPD